MSSNSNIEFPVSILEIGRRWTRALILPFIQGPEEVLVGGQAVIEGVMMRSPHSYAVAVRRPDGSLALTQDALDRPSERHPWLKYPVLRGLGVLGQAMALGIRALRFSAQAALEDPKTAGAEHQQEKKAEISNWILALNLIFSIGFFILFYKFLPLYLATLVKSRWAPAENLVVFNLIDGTIRIVASHYDEVKVLPPGFRVLASDQLCPVQIMRHATLPVYGIQGHPERFGKERPEGGALLLNFLKIALMHNQAVRSAAEASEPQVFAAGGTKVKLPTN